MMKKLSILFILTLLTITFIGCNNPQTINEDDSNTSNDSQFVEYGVAGYITNITPSDNGSVLGTVLVEGSEDNGAQYDKAVVTVTSDTKIYLNDLTDFTELEIGMYVNVFFEGPVRESYPVQADAKQINIIPDDVSNDEKNE